MLETLIQPNLCFTLTNNLRRDNMTDATVTIEIENAEEAVVVEIHEVAKDADLIAAMKVNDKGIIQISADDIKAAAKRASIDIDEVNAMQNKVNEFIGDVANVAGRVAVDHMAENAETMKVVTRFSVGQTQPELTVDRVRNYPVEPGNKDNTATKAVYAHSRLDMKKSMPDNFRKNIQKNIQEYGETRLSDYIKDKK